MNTDNLIFLGSITNAMKAREILINYRITSSIEKLPKSMSPNGCGYALKVSNKYDQAVDILRKSGLLKTDTNWKEMPP